MLLIVLKMIASFNDGIYQLAPYRFRLDLISFVLMLMLYKVKQKNGS